MINNFRVSLARQLHITENLTTYSYWLIIKDLDYTVLQSIEITYSKYMELKTSLGIES